MPSPIVQILDRERLMRPSAPRKTLSGAPVQVVLISIIARLLHDAINELLRFLDRFFGRLLVRNHLMHLGAKHVYDLLQLWHGRPLPACNLTCACEIIDCLDSRTAGNNSRVLAHAVPRAHASAVFGILDHHFLARQPLNDLPGEFLTILGDIGGNAKRPTAESRAVWRAEPRGMRYICDFAMRRRRRIAVPSRGITRPYVRHGAAALREDPRAFVPSHIENARR